MVSAHSPEPDSSVKDPITNHIIKTLSSHGGAYKTFGENIILLLNRESEYRGFLSSFSVDNPKVRPVFNFSY